MLTSKQKIIIAISVVAVISFFISSFSQANRKNLEVDILDVGQGDAILIKTQFGQNILIDGGPDSSVIKKLSENLPWWDRRIDLMVLTHPHDDHVTGLVDVLKRYKTEQIIYTGVTHTAPNYLKWLEAIKETKTPIGIITGRKRIDLGPDCYLDILYPDEDLSGKSFADLNESSIVARLVYGQTSFLLTGDADVVVEEKILNFTTPNPSLKQGGGIIGSSTPSSSPLKEGGGFTPDDLKADVLKVGHHGSDTSTGEDWLEAVKPKIAIISVGKENSFGHPSLRIINRLERFGAKILRTDLRGTVRLVSDGKIVISK